MGVRFDFLTAKNVAVFQTAIFNIFIPRALPWAIAIYGLQPLARRAYSATAQGNALGIKALQYAV
jgi:hypothetical protein